MFFERCVQEDKLEELEELERLIEDVFCDSEPSDVDINDFVWFEAEDLIFENDDCDE